MYNFLLQVGYDMTKKAAEKCFEKAGLKPTDVDVIELHDCFSVNELITYEALGLCPEGNSISGDHCFIELESIKNIFLSIHIIRTWRCLLDRSSVFESLTG